MKLRTITEMCFEIQFLKTESQYLSKEKSKYLTERFCKTAEKILSDQLYDLLRKYWSFQIPIL